MSDNNGWTGQPGVPCEHQNRRWHWLQGPLGEVFICEWIPINKVGIWVRDHATITPANITPQHKYLGPALTPAEVEARVKESVDLGRDIATRELDPQIAMLAPWKAAIENALLNWCDAVEDHETPKDALQRLIRLEVMAALDPKVSQAAADLVAAARKDWLAELNHDTDALMEAARDSALEEAARWHDEQGRFWMEKGREVSALDSQSGLNLLAKAAEHRKHAAAIRALSDTPPGMVLVPREPTNEMIHAGGYALQEHAAMTMDAARIAWDAMVKAAGKEEGDE